MTSSAQAVMQKNGRRKALFIQGKKECCVEEVVCIAKQQALRIGFRHESLLRILKCDYDGMLDGWIVVVTEDSFAIPPTWLNGCGRAVGRDAADRAVDQDRT
jgi:hypothetical protein